jgi:hypothetical protein
MRALKTGGNPGTPSPVRFTVEGGYQRREGSFELPTAFLPPEFNALHPGVFRCHGISCQFPAALAHHHRTSAPCRRHHRCSRAGKIHRCAGERQDDKRQFHRNLSRVEHLASANGRTLASAVVAFKTVNTSGARLLSESYVNAILVLVVLTCVAGPILSARYARRMITS